MSDEQLQSEQKKASGFFTAIGDFFTSWGANGAAWQLTLCSFLGLIIIFYIVLHLNGQGSEYVKLNANQVQTVNNLMSNFPESDTQSQATDDTVLGPKIPGVVDSLNTAKNVPAEKQANANQKESPTKSSSAFNRIRRNLLIVKYLQNEYDGNLETKKLDSVKSLLSDLDNKDAGNFLKDKMLLSKSFFWLTGNSIYFEAWMWSLIGVLVSLIYYVSIANTKSLNTAGDDDSGPFDPKAVSPQIAKMFYAPVCTIVLILGYHYMSDKNGNMVDIAVNNGFIIFSFICGFFSGRVMKFLDNLKDLVLPLSGTSKPPSSTNQISKTDVVFKLQLSDKIINEADSAAIIATAFKDAVIVLTPSGGGQDMTFKKLPEEKGNLITVKGITPGDYTMRATMVFKKDDSNIINLENSQPVNITPDTKEFTIAFEQLDIQNLKNDSVVKETTENVEIPVDIDITKKLGDN